MGKWEMARLGDVFLSIKNGANIKQGADEGSGYPITRIETISDGNIDRKKMGYARITNIDPYKDNVLESGDILMSHINSIKHLGKTALYEKEDDETIIHGMNLLRLKPNRQVIDSKYVKNYFDAYDFKRQIPRITKDSVNQSSFNVKELHELTIPLPPLEVQQQIADVLNRANDLIKKRKAQTDKLNLLIKSQFIEMFGDPVTNPRGWEKKKLKESATLLNGRAYSQTELLRSGKYPVLRVGNFFSNRDWYYSDLELDEEKYCNTGDLLFAWSASFGARIWTGGKTIYHYHIWKVVYRENYNKMYLCHLLNYATKSLMNDTHGIAMMHLTKNGMEQTEFVVPPLTQQNQFADFVHQVEAQKSLIQLSLDKLEQNYNSLMQKCFKGELF